MSIFAELKRRNVFRVAIAYLLLAWVVQQVADVFFPALSLPEWTVRLVAGLLILGFPLVLFFAWAFELTPEGLKREREVNRVASITHRTGRKLDFLIIGVLLIVIATLVVDRFTDTENPDLPAEAAIQQASIAVLPFLNLSDDQANEFFSDGVAEEVLNRLVQIEELRVPSRTSSFAFRGNDLPVSAIAQELKVRYVLTGSVRKSGNRVRISVQLIEAATDSNLWSETFERDLTDIFQIQKEISATAARMLQVELDPEYTVTTGADTVDIEAYQRFLEGRYLILRRGQEGEPGLRRSIELFNEAIAIEPQYARAYAGRATSYVLLPGYSNSPPPDAKPLAEQSITKALELDPNSGEAYATLGLLRANELRWTEADVALRRAIELTPNDGQALMWYGMILVCSGRTSDALQILLRANDIDPYSPLVAHWLADVYRNMGENELSLKQAQRSVDLGMKFSTMGIYIYHLLQDDIPAAKISLEESLDQLGFSTAHVAPVVAAIEDAEYVDAAAAALAEAKEQVPLDTFWMYFDLGAPKLLFDELDQRPDDQVLRYYRFWEPQLAALRQHPRFEKAMNDAGLVDYWQNHSWPDLCRPADEGFKCD